MVVSVLHLKNMPVNLLRTYVNSARAKKKRVILLPAFLSFFFPLTLMAEYKFDNVMLGTDVDLSVFNEGGQLPGVYPVDILLNGDKVDSRNMLFKKTKDAKGVTSLTTCLTKDMLLGYGVKVDDYPSLFADKTKESGCANLSAIPYASDRLDFGAQSLLISIPQVALQETRSGIEHESTWDDGIPAVLLNYRINSSKVIQKATGESDTSTSVQLEPGLNLGAWRLRNSSTWQKSSTDSGKWESAYTYIEKAVNELKSRLTVGQTTTSSELLDGVVLTGLKIESDDDMIPYVERSFAPVVRGVARTQARVEIRQNGYLIHSKNVAPGPFEINDLSGAGSSGDLNVTVAESDGSTQVFTVPFSTPAIALREGQVKYSVATGEYRSTAPDTDKPLLTQLSLFYGLPWGITAYSGTQFSSSYSAVSGGLGLSLGNLGAVSVDDTHARWNNAVDGKQSGDMLRLRYSKDFITTNTGVSVSTSRYSPSGFIKMSEALDGSVGNELNTLLPSKKMSAFSSVTLSQSLGRAGRINASGIRSEYRNSGAVQNSYSLSWSAAYSYLNWNLSWSKNTLISGNSKNGKTDEQLFNIWLSVPLSINTSMTYSSQLGEKQKHVHRIGMNGNGFDKKLTWAVSESVSNAPSLDHAGTLNLGWLGRYGEISTGYSYAPSFNTINGGVSGGIIIHDGGITAGQQLGTTNALVTVPDVSGVAVSGPPGVRTDFRGYTTVPHLTPYQKNNISIDPGTLPVDADIKQTDIHVVPTAGAVTIARFSVKTGNRILIHITLADGKKVPFGAVVTDSGAKQSTEMAIVNEDSEVFMTVQEPRGVLSVRWGRDSSQQCTINYLSSTTKKETNEIENLHAVCR